MGRDFKRHRGEVAAAEVRLGDDPFRAGVRREQPHLAAPVHRQRAHGHEPCSDAAVIRNHRLGHVAHGEHDRVPGAQIGARQDAGGEALAAGAELVIGPALLRCHQRQLLAVTGEGVPYLVGQARALPVALAPIALHQLGRVGD